MNRLIRIVLGGLVLISAPATGLLAQQLVEDPANAVRLITPPALLAVEAPDADELFCLTSSLQEVWLEDEEAWEPFSQQLNGTCNDAGQRLEIEGQSHFLDTWELSYVWKQSYDGDGNLIEWLRLKPNSEGTDYENDSRTSWQFDGSAMQTSYLYEEWDGTQWVNVDRTITEYSGDQATSSTSQEWDGSQWVNVSRSRLDESSGDIFAEVWDGAAWAITERQQIVQTGDNFVQTIATWDGSQFVNSLRYTKADDYLRVETWSGTEWVGVQNQALTFDEHGNRIELIEQAWDGSGWANDYRARYVFTSDGQAQTEFYLDDWDGTGWVDDHRQLSTLDSFGNEIEELWQEWDGSSWVNLQRYTRTYEAVDGVANESLVATSGVELAAAHPNPASESATVRFELGQTGPATITLHDVLGRTVKSHALGTSAAGEHMVTIDLSGLASGIYFYRLQTADALLTRSLVVRR